MSKESISKMSLLHKIQDSKAIKVFILDDTVEGKIGKNVKAVATTTGASLLPNPDDQLLFHCTASASPLFLADASNFRSLYYFSIWLV